MKYYVNKSGNDNNTGLSESKALLTINSGINKLSNPDDTLIIGGGSYKESVNIRGKHGTAGHPITIKGKAGQTVNIDGTLEDFWNTSLLPLTTKKWIRASTLDPQAHPDEYVSKEPLSFTNIDKDGIKGAFFDTTGTKYIRLINHSTLWDLRSLNEKFGKIIDPPDMINYVKVVNEQGVPVTVRIDGVDKEYYFPFFYMGPGIWLNRDPDSINYGKIHIRLSHTHHKIPGLADYNGQKDPNKIRLAISKKSSNTLYVGGSQYLELKNLCIRFGGEHSVYVQGGQDITFDHLRFCCSEYGVSIGNTNGFEMQNCELDGGLPSWYFRSDRKSEYNFKQGTSVLKNNVGSQTSSSLLLGGNNNLRLNIHHCEFRNGHDLYLPGEVEFHHNLVTNMNDDAVFFSQKDGCTSKVHHNVITKCLTCFSFIGNEREPLQGGPWYIYRNLIDLRLPTASFRPFHPNAVSESGIKEVFRQGWLHKSNGPSGNYHIFHNTILVYSVKSPHAYFTHLLPKGSSQRRTSFNNIFLGLNQNPDIRKPIMMLPSPVFPDITDGNLYYRLGTDAHLAFQHLEYTYEGNHVAGQKFESLTGEYLTSTLFTQSQNHYPPGYEKNSLYAHPKFRRMVNEMLFFPLPSEDLRLANNSPAIGKGLELPTELNELDPVAPGVQRDMGCYALHAEPLKVGINERHSYPNNLI